MRRAGYAFRQSYEQFLTRYKMLALATWPLWHGVPGEGVVELLESLQIPEEDYALGKAKIFIRNPRTVQLIDFKLLTHLVNGFIQK